MTEKLTAYVDVKSPYAYLAIEPTRRLARQTGIAIDWVPYTLDIPSYLGSAEVDEAGQVIAQDRNPHQWRRVRYSYMDVRRYANLRGLTIKGTRKIWDSSLASIALLWARERNRARRRFNAASLSSPSCSARIASVLKSMRESSTRARRSASGKFWNC